MHSNDTLVRALHENRLDGASELFRTSAPRLTAYLRGLGASQENAEDLVADTFAILLRELANGRGPTSNPTAYLHTVARRLLTRSRAESHRVVTTDDDHTLDQPVDLPDPVVAGVEQGLVRDAYLTLGERDRHILWLSLVEGQSTGTIAKQLGVPPARVATQIYRARKALQVTYLAAFAKAKPRPAACSALDVALAEESLGRASARKSAELQAHLAGCAQCQDLSKQLSDERGTMRAVTTTVLLLGLLLGSPSISDQTDPPEQAPETQGRSAAAGRRRRTRRTVGTVLIVLALLGTAVQEILPGGFLSSQQGDGTDLDSLVLPQQALVPLEDLTLPPATPDEPLQVLPTDVSVPVPTSANSATWNMTLANLSESPLPVGIMIVDENASADSFPGIYVELVLDDGTVALPRTLLQEAIADGTIAVGIVPVGHAARLTGTVSTTGEPMDLSALRLRFTSRQEVVDQIVAQRESAASIPAEAPGTVERLADEVSSWPARLVATRSILLLMLVVGTLLVVTNRRTSADTDDDLEDDLEGEVDS